MKKVLNMHEAIVDKYMSDPRYVTKTTWSEFGIKGFGSLVTEDCGDKIRASLVNCRGSIVFKKYFFKTQCVAKVV